MYATVAIAADPWHSITNQSLSRTHCRFNLMLVYLHCFNLDYTDQGALDAQYQFITIWSDELFKRQDKLFLTELANISL